VKRGTWGLGERKLEVVYDLWFEKLKGEKESEKFI